jgi:hypothetical protein
MRLSREWIAIVPYAVWTRAEDAASVEVVVERYDDGGDAYALVVAGPWRAAAAASLRDDPDAPWPGELIMATPRPTVPHAWRLLRPPHAGVPEYAAFLVCGSHGPQRFGPTPEAPGRVPTDVAPGRVPTDVAPGRVPTAAIPAPSGRDGGRRRPWVPLVVPPPDEAALRVAVAEALRATVEGWQPALVALR